MINVIHDLFIGVKWYRVLQQVTAKECSVPGATGVSGISTYAVPTVDNQYAVLQPYRVPCSPT